MNSGEKLVKRLSMDLIYSLLGIMVFNASLQLIVYPMMERRIGTEAFGNVLTLLSVISIAASSFGSAANYSRMLANANHPTKNGDYNRFLSLTSVLSVAAAIVSLYIFDSFTLPLIVSFSILMIVSIFRYYADVPFRLSLNYKYYFLYYVAASIGYIVGTLVFSMKNTWAIAFALGEASALLFAFLKSDIFKGPHFQKSDYYAENMNALTALASANLLSSLVLNADRFLIRLTTSAEMVTVFYAATLIGKVVSMLGTPLNSVLIGYLSKVQLTKRHVGIAVLISLTITICATFACWIGSIILIRLLYPSVYEVSRPFFMMGNLGQIFYFVSNTLMVLVMCICREKISLYVSLLHIILFCIFVIPAGLFVGIWGIVISLAAVNIIKYIVILLIAWRKAPAASSAKPS